MSPASNEKEETLSSAIALLELLSSQHALENFFHEILNRKEEEEEEEARSKSNSKCVFFEISSTALRALSNVFKKETAETLKRSAVKTIAKKSRIVSLFIGDDQSDDMERFEELFGCGISMENVQKLFKFFARCTRSSGSSGGGGDVRVGGADDVDSDTNSDTNSDKYGVIVSVRLRCGESVAIGATYEESKNTGKFGKSENDEAFVAYPVAPSTKFLELQSSPGKETDDVKWLYCDDKGNARTEEMPNFKWKGKLRPWKISHQEKLFRGMRKVPDSVVKAEWWETSRPLAEERARQQRVADELPKNEIEKLRKACEIGRGAIDCVVRAIRPGVTPEALDVLCHDYICDNNAYPSPLNYYCFPKSCCISVNEVICHGIPDCRPLERGDIVNVDVTAFFGGYHGDLNETVYVGNANVDSGENSEAAKKLLKCAYECLASGIAVVKPDARYRDIGENVSSVADKYDCSVVRTYCGHGIGKHFHCFPNVPHYKGNKATGAMKPGHAFTIEPMINLSKEWRDELWPDGWTAVTKDGSLSAQYEHTMVCTEFGVDVLTKRTKNSPKVFPFIAYDHSSTGEAPPNDVGKTMQVDSEPAHSKIVSDLESLIRAFNNNVSI
jgi:methionyl aminopeptidase